MSFTRHAHEFLTEATGRKTNASLMGLALAASCCSTFGLGIRIADQDPFATARGNAFVATADNPSAIYYNPAGITQLEGHQASLGVYSILLESEYTSPTGVRADTKDRLQFVPQVYLTCSPKDKPYSFGLGVYAPYGLGLEWPEDTGFRTLAVRGEILYLTVNPVLAWELHPTLSVAVGPTFNYSEADLRRGVFAPGDRFRFKGDDVDIGYTAGLLWKPHPMHAFGLSYRSASTLNYTGQADITGTGPFDASNPANARFPFPQNVILGWSFRPTPDWNLEFDADWTDWDRLNVVTLNRTGAASVALPFNWRGSFFYEWGVTRYFERGWRASAGYIFSENSVPDASFNPIVPDSDRHIFSAGVGRQYQRARWDFAYQFAYGPTRTVSGSPPNPFPPESGDGRYQFISHALTLSFGYNF